MISLDYLHSVEGFHDVFRLIAVDPLPRSSGENKLIAVIDGVMPETLLAVISHEFNLIPDSDLSHVMVEVPEDSTQPPSLHYPYGTQLIFDRTSQLPTQVEINEPMFGLTNSKSSGLICTHIAGGLEPISYFE